MVELPTDAEPVRVVETDALTLLRALPSASIDSVVTDPPYPCIDREYGRWTEAEWFALMDPVVEECRRVLRPSGSAVFIIQPNSERVGKMRTWWLRFMLQWAERWGMVQDAWWWNPSALPSGGIDRRIGLMRPSVKPCAWFGLDDCFRDQGAVLWAETKQSMGTRLMERFERKSPAGSRRVVQRRMGDTALERGGVTPFNLLPVAPCNRQDSNGAGTPEELARWWVRYITPPGGTVLDPFLGSGTTALAALAEGRLCVGSERFPKYAEIARKRVREAMGTGLFAAV